MKLEKSTWEKINWVSRYFDIFYITLRVELSRAAGRAAAAARSSQRELERERGTFK